MGVEEFFEIRHLSLIANDCSIFVFTKGGFPLISTPQGLHYFVGLSCVVNRDLVICFLQNVFASFVFIFY